MIGLMSVSLVGKDYTWDEDEQEYIYTNDEGEKVTISADDLMNELEDGTIIVVDGDEYEKVDGEWFEITFVPGEDDEEELVPTKPDDIIGGTNEKENVD